MVRSVTVGKRVRNGAFVTVIAWGLMACGFSLDGSERRRGGRRNGERRGNDHAARRQRGSADGATALPAPLPDGATPTNEAGATCGRAISPRSLAPAPLVGLNTASHELSLRLSPDELTVYFESDRPGALGSTTSTSRPVRTSTRSLSAGFMPGVNTSSDDYDPTISADGLTLVISQKIGSTDVDLYAYTRATTNDPFGSATPLTSINSGQSDLQLAQAARRPRLCA